MFKGTVHLKITILSSLSHPQVVKPVYISAEHKGRYFEECW